MQELLNNGYFWQKIDSLSLSTNLVINQVKGSRHPQYLNMVYPVDYGYLADVDTIKVYKGSDKRLTVDAVMIVADILKRDLEVKLLWGCTADEELEILRFINQTDYQKGILVRRANTMPEWAITD